MDNPSIFIDISDEEWKILQIRRDKGRITFKRCDVINARNRAPAEFERDLKSVPVVRNAETIVSLPRKKVIFKHLRLPSSDPKEISKMVGLQLVSRIPYSLSEVVYDHVILRTEDTGYTHVQAAVVLTAAVDEYLQILKPLSLSIRRMSVSSYGIAGWLNMLAQKRAWPLHKVFMVLDMDRTHGEVCFCRDGQAVFSRFIPAGFEDVSRQETGVFLQQLQWSLDLYHKEHAGEEPGHAVIVVSGDAAALKDAIAVKWNMAVDVVDPSDVIDDKDRAAFRMPAAAGCSWAAALGHALGTSAPHVNLSPGTLKKNYTSRQHSRRRVVSVWLAAGVIAAAVAFAVMEMSLRRACLRDVEVQAGDIRPRAERLQKMMEHTRALDDYFRKRVPVSDMMKELYKRTPEDVVYQSIYWTQEGEWILQGYAQTRSGVNNLQSGLIDSSRFQDVRLDYATKRKLGNVEVTDFRIQCRGSDAAQEAR